MSDRIPCINPRCRRTAPVEKFAGEEIVCAKCWKLLPRALTDRHKALNKRERRMLRLVERRIAKGAITAGQVYEAEASIARQRMANWQNIRACFLAPDKPDGLDAFLDEIGM